MTDEKKRALAGTSNKLLAALRHLRDTEWPKRQLPISSPAFDELAAEVERTSRENFRLARHQDRLGDDADASPRGSETIDDVDKDSDRESPRQS